MIILTKAFTDGCYSIVREKHACTQVYNFVQIMPKLGIQHKMWGYVFEEDDNDDCLEY